MNLTQEQVARLAKLTALHPDDTLSIDSVLSSIDDIQKADTNNVSQVTRSGNATLHLHPDAILEDEKLPTQLLQCSPQKVAAHQIVLAGIMQGE